ncbi:MAG: glycosyltransferase family 4 protein [Treponema sp.]|jgi:glycosyltransferase involved in cell wall biosynthesis|nr:glycosyltransferase family 4 protein [Treponema sp.]
MNVSFDVLPLLTEKKTGIGYYTEYLIKEIIRKYPNNSYTLDFFTLKEDNIRFVSGFLRDNVRANACKWFRSCWYKLLRPILPFPYSFFFGKVSDVYVFCNYYVPPFVPGKKILVVHDLVFRDLSETVNIKTKYALKMFFKKSLKYADVIITVSDFTKERLFHYYPFVKNKQVYAVHSGVDAEKFYSKDNSSEEKTRVKNKYKISGEYFIYLGTLEPRKNLPNLIKAYSNFISKAVNAPKLVMAGGKGWLYDEIFTAVKGLRLENNIIFTGYVDENDVAPLIKGAVAFCFVALYEGFGLPVLEAMACGTAVITSNVSSLPEVAGDAALLVDPLNVDDIANGLAKLYYDSEYREKFIAKGYERVKLFSWENTAEKFVSHFSI